MSDPFVPVMAAALLDCLCANVAGLTDPPQHCCYRVGTEIAHDLGPVNDLCCEGLAYVALGDTYPSSASFPEQDIVRQAEAACAPPTWAQSFRVGIVRCVPVVGADGVSPPSCADWNLAAAQNFEDSWALRRTACCFRTWVRARTDALLGMAVVIERQVQTNPLGGCVERYFTIAVQFPNCDC
jgi:hypothetical protein